MTLATLWRPITLDVPCTVDVEHSAASLHAHVTLDGGLELEPGDEVIVSAALGLMRFGERRIVRATATVKRAPWWRRRWVAACSLWNLCSLYEVSFSENVTP